MNFFFVFGAKYLYILIVFFFVFFFIGQTKKVRKKFAIFSFFVLPVSYFFGKLVGLFFYNPRPFVVKNFTPLIYHIPDNGFPSDHTLLSATLAFIVFSFNKKMGWLLILLTMFVGISRVYVGVHHFTDIFGSIIIAGLTVAFATFIFSKIKKYY